LSARLVAYREEQSKLAALQQLFFVAPCPAFSPAFVPFAALQLSIHLAMNSIAALMKRLKKKRRGTDALRLEFFVPKSK